METPHTHKISHLVTLPTLIITNNNQRNYANKEGTKEGNRTTPKEVLCGIFGRCSREGSCCNHTTPPPKERVKQRDRSLFFLMQSAICKSHQKSLLQSNVEYRGNWGGNNFSYTFRTSSDKTLVKRGRSETNQCSARWICQKTSLPNTFWG